MPWTVAVKLAQNNGNAADVTATFTDPVDSTVSFTWASRVKTNNPGSVTKFVTDCQEHLGAYQADHATEAAKAAAIAATLNGG